MANDYYNPSGAPSTGSSGSSATQRSEFSSISAGFDKLPNLNAHANEFVIVNSGGTAMSAVNNSTALATMGGQPASGELTALAALDATVGAIIKTANNTYVRRVVVGTANEVTVTNGNGAAGNITLSLPSPLTLTGKTVQGGAYNNAAISGSNFNSGTANNISISNSTFAGNATARLNNLNVVAPASVATLNIANNVTLAVSANTTLAGVATQADQETGTSTTTFVSPGRQQHHQSASKGWVLSDTNGGALASYNVSSITDSGAGQWTVNWTTAFSSSSYEVNATMEASTGGLSIMVNASAGRAAGSTPILVQNSASVPTDPNYFHVSVFGDQA